jgi:RNA polymerase sigma-70 factor (ECF subfamily)
VVAGPEVSWLGPIPDALVTGPAEDPAAIAVARESLRLGLIACLQYLPARQRAVLILRDVLAFPAAEVAAMLGTSTVAVKSTLQRARARLEQVAPSPEDVSEPAEPEARALLEAYISAFQNADPAALERVLRKDAALEPVGSLTWFSGRDTCMRYVRQFFGAPGDWQMAATAANGQPAAAAYLRGPDGVHRAFGLAVLTVTGTGIARIVVFGDPGLVTRFGFPAVQ